ncbi:MAG: metalloregulator ArsR/SmtB family transcription factor [Patescibacteria group bacterium]
MTDECCQKGSRKQNKLNDLKRDFDILNDVNRLRILCLIKEHDEICVCDIYKNLNLPQNLVSYHLSKLKETGFVKSKKQGVKVLYSQGGKKINDFQKIINNLFTK